MKVYYYSTTSIHGRDSANKGTQFECLNELKDASSRAYDNLECMDKFVFECDAVDKHTQLERAIDLFDKGIVQRITDSGNKSIHVIIQVKQCADLINCKDSIDIYKIIWHYLNKKYFNNDADTACSNPNRLTRTPNAVRDSNNKIQYCYKNSSNKYSLDKTDIRSIKSEYDKLKCLRDLQVKSFITAYNGKCANYETITRYLNTPFPKVNGNGVSSKWLFAAIKTCQKYNDNTTLEQVLNKARSEKWTEKELNRIINAKPR